MDEYDPLWLNVTGYMGPIREYNPDNWTYLKQEDILELLIEVTVGQRVYFERFVMEYADVADCHIDLVAFHLDRMVASLDRKLERTRERRQM